jgi:hypothetical protein
MNLKSIQEAKKVFELSQTNEFTKGYYYELVRKVRNLKTANIHFDYHNTSKILASRYYSYSKDPDKDPSNPRQFEAQDKNFDYDVSVLNSAIEIQIKIVEVLMLYMELSDHFRKVQNVSINQLSEQSLGDKILTLRQYIKDSTLSKRSKEGVQYCNKLFDQIYSEDNL